jgi:uncharacterized membrane protein YjfL (UPF0719 family)
MKMNIGIAALLYFVVPIVALIGALQVYVALTGYENGEGLKVITENVPSMYPFTGPTYDPRHIEIINNTNTNI